MPRPEVVVERLVMAVAGEPGEFLSEEDAATCGSCDRRVVALFPRRKFEADPHVLRLLYTAEQDAISTALLAYPQAESLVNHGPEHVEQPKKIALARSVGADHYVEITNLDGYVANEAKRSRSTFVSLCGAGIDPMVRPKSRQVRYRRLNFGSGTCSAPRRRGIVSKPCIRGDRGAPCLPALPAKGLGHESGTARHVRSDRLKHASGLGTKVHANQTEIEQEALRK